MAAKKAKRAGWGRSAHPGVVLVPPRGAYTSWRARWRDPDTNKFVWDRVDPLKYSTAEARRDWAVAKSKELSKRSQALEDGAPRATGTTLEKAIERYYEDHPRLSPKTVKGKKATTAALLLWAKEVGITTCDQITRVALMNLRAWIQKRPKHVQAHGGKRNTYEKSENLRSAQTVNTELARTLTVLAYLRSLQLLPKATGDDLEDAFKLIRVVR